MSAASAIPTQYLAGQEPRAVDALSSTVARWPRGLRIYLAIHGFFLAMYAFLGKGFAYAGWPPLYAGEVLLVLAIVALIMSGRLSVLLRNHLGIVFCGFLFWQVFCTLPYLATFGIDALRDSAIWGYGIFAFAIASIVLRLPGFPEVAVVRYRSFAGKYLFLGPAACIATLYFVPYLPHWPDTSVSIPSVKTGEYSAHIAGLFSFVLVGLAKNKPWWLPCLTVVAMLSLTGRGGLSAVLLTVAISLALRPRTTTVVPLAAITASVILVMATFDVRVTIPGTVRELSLGQLTANLESLVTHSEFTNLEGTKNWRIAWWQTIVNYTVDGPYFWTGKGYGINLADSDGFQVGTRDEPLRSPHNSHLTLLARSGVPGFVLWVVLQLSWAFSILSSFWVARRHRQDYWAATFSWLFAYWVAFMVSASFDVFLEGPMAGIPFWTLFGLGWSFHVLYQTARRAEFQTP